MECVNTLLVRDVCAKDSKRENAPHDVDLQASGQPKTPICLLFDELLVEIWNHVRSSEIQTLRSRGGIPFPYIASWVSARWRNIALSTPVIWRDVYISPYRTVELVRTQLERSRDCSLNILVNTNDPKEMGPVANPSSLRNLRELMVLVVAHVGRWYSLEINTAECFYSGTNTMLPLLHDAYAPRLQHLNVPNAFYNAYAKPLFLGGAPMLSHVILHRTNLRQNLHLLSGLVQLDLEVPAHGRPSHVDFRNLLAACPLLTYLNLIGPCFNSDSTIDHVTPVSLPSLRTLGIRRFVDYDAESDLFSMISAPGLQYLRLDNFNWGGRTAFVRAMRREPPSSRFPVLSKLSFDCTKCDVDNILPLLALFPHQ